MKERFVEIATPDGRMEAYVTHPEDAGPFPAIVFYSDVLGMREQINEIARRVGIVGYYCMVPDVYYRSGGIRFDVLRSDSGARTMHDLDPAKQDIVKAAQRSLSDTMVVRDSAAIWTFLDGEPVRKGAKGIVGFCMGGRFALGVAGNYPDQVRATAIFHGSNMVNDNADSPHRNAAKAQGEVYCGFPENDPLAPMTTIETLAKIMKDGAARYQYQIHKGAEHGYSIPDRPIHHKQASNRDWERIFAMFHRQIPARPV